MGFSSAAAADHPKLADRFKNLPPLPLVSSEALGTWHVDAAEMEAKLFGATDAKKVVGRPKGTEEDWAASVTKKKEVAERLLVQYTREFESSRGRSGDIKMLIATQRSGTAVDKVSAHSVMVAENPIANIRSLDALLAMVTSKVGKRHALTGFETLKELFISSLLPDRKLKSLIQQPLNHLPESRDAYSLLLFWYFEECLKQRYECFIFALEEASRDMLPILKDKALKIISALLRSKPEQERRLLSALVNKLGDPESKAASNVDFHLSNLLYEHPNMKAVVIDEVDKFIFRPRLGLKAKYHAVNFLSQLHLSQRGDGPKLAKRLIDVYFAVFKVLISMADSEQRIDKSLTAGDTKKTSSSKKKNIENSSESHIEMDSRILSAILTGVNRAFPFVSSNEVDDLIEVQTPVLFQLVHSKNFNVGVQALMLLDKISSKNLIVSDRFFRALYSKLLLPSAMNSSKAEMFIGLLLRAMKTDVNLKRVSAFAKRLLQVALQQPPQYACGCLFLLSEVLKARPPLWNMVLQSELVDDDLEHFEDIVEETDSASKKTENKNNFVDSFDSAKPDIDSCKDLDDSSDISPSPSSSDELSDEGEELIVEYGSKGVPESKKILNHDSHQQSRSIMKSLLPGGYNPRHREPSYCNADHVSWWELSVLASHVHPSVAMMAKTLLSGANIVYNGNPLNDLSLTAFLDKFMEKKPKQSTWHGASQIEPARKLEMNNHLIGEEILSLAEADVPPEDLVFHKFYANKMNSSKKPKKKKKAAADEAAEDLFNVGGDESDNDEIENMLDAADVALEPDGDYDYDDLDQVVDEDDEDLVGDATDREMDFLSHAAREDGDSENDGGIDIGDVDDHGGDDFDTGDVAVDDGDGDENPSQRRKRKRMSGGKKGVSPFASLEEYEHLLTEQDPAEQKPNKLKHSKSKKKKRSIE